MMCQRAASNHNHQLAIVKSSFRMILEEVPSRHVTAGDWIQRMLPHKTFGSIHAAHSGTRHLALPHCVTRIHQR